MPHIVFMCTANICRSPVAQVLFADWLRRQGLGSNWRVSSAGTWAEPGAAASTYSRQLMAEAGLDLEHHSAQRADADLLAGADLVLCMTASQREGLQLEFPRYANRIYLLTELVGPGYDVDDPYGGPREGYVEMVRELRGLIERAGPRILALVSQR